MNKVILLGRLTKDPELRYTSTNNTAVCTFNLAVNRRFAKTEDPVKADFIPIVAWSKLAEFCGKYFSKGRQVAIVGRIQVRTWDDSEGKRHYVTEVIAEEAYFADSKKDGIGETTYSNNSVPQNYQATTSNNSEYDYNQYNQDDDDLPF